MSGELVRDVMHYGVIDCSPGCAIQEVARKMTEHDVSALVVVDDLGYLVGVVSRTDLVKARALEEYWKYWKGMNAEHIMTREVVTVTPDTSVVEASRLLAERRIHRLIIVDGQVPKAKPIGVLSITDIVREMAEE